MRHPFSAGRHSPVDGQTREAALARLREHYAAGSLDDAAYEERAGLVLTARTGGDLRCAFLGLTWNRIGGRRVRRSWLRRR